MLKKVGRRVYWMGVGMSPTSTDYRYECRKLHQYIWPSDILGEKLIRRRAKFACQETAGRKKFTF